MTVEAGRPDTITREKLEVLREHGIERISINPQTMSDQVLQAIGRRHTARDIREAFCTAREVDFACINMDLIAGLPQDSVEGFRDSLEGVLAMGPENITVHTLAMKKGSRLMEEGARFLPVRRRPEWWTSAWRPWRGRLPALLPLPAEVHVRRAGKCELVFTGNGKPL